MNKMCLALAFGTLAAAAVAGTEIAVDVRMPQMKRPKHEALLRRLGGFIINEKSGSGTFALVNTQKETGLEPLHAAAERLRADLMIRTAVCQAERPAFDEIGELLRKINANAGVVAVSDPALPALLVAPESGWALVNVTRLFAGDASKETRETRLRRELIRACSFVGGGHPTRSFGCIMNPVLKPSDLDRLPKETLSMEVVPDMMRYFERFGIRPFEKGSYRSACKQGWAPAPTNDYQKAIWDEVHALPTKPIKILPETKKVTE